MDEAGDQGEPQTHDRPGEDRGTLFCVHALGEDAGHTYHRHQLGSQRFSAESLVAGRGRTLIAEKAPAKETDLEVDDLPDDEEIADDSSDADLDDDLLEDDGDDDVPLDEIADVAGSDDD